MLFYFFSRFKAVVLLERAAAAVCEGTVQREGGASGNQLWHTDCRCGGEEVARCVGIGRGLFSQLNTLLGGVEGAVFPDGFVCTGFTGCFDEFVVFFVVVQLERS